MSQQPASPPPAYFLSLSLENVRSFGEKQTISFLNNNSEVSQWTIILGDNGVGKTTILKSLAAVSPMPDPGVKEFLIPSYLVGWPYVWHPVRHGGERKASINYVMGEGAYLSNPTGRVEYKTRWKQHLTVEKKSGDVEKLNRSGSVLTEEGRNLICYGYGAGRTVGSSTLANTEDSVINSYASLFDERADLLNPEEWFLQLDYSSYKEQGGEGKSAMNLERVRQALLQVLPDVADIQIKSTKQQQQLELLTPYGWVRLRDMSLGYQTLVVWLTDFASKLFIRYPDSPNPLEEPAIVLIDEIDLHLHPSWQRKLIGFLSGIFKNTQFIATAHSHLVVQAAGDAGANVVLLKREGDQTIVQQNPEDVRGWRIDQILTSAFFNLDTAQSPETEKKLTRQATLLNKPKLTAKERRELDALTLELEGVPMGSTDAEREEAEILRQLTARLKQS